MNIKKVHQHILYRGFSEHSYYPHVRRFCPRQITVQYLVEMLNITYGSVQTILMEDLLMK